MAITYLMSFSMGFVTLVIIYIFDWFKFRSNLNFIVNKICECCCPCCCKKKEKELYETVKEEGDGKNFSEIILEKFGLLIRTHPYGKSGIQGLEKLKFLKINRQRYPDFSNYYNNINLYQFQMLLNESQKQEEKLVNQIFEYEGSNNFKDVSNSYYEIPNNAVDKSILFKFTL